MRFQKTALRAAPSASPFKKRRSAPRPLYLLSKNGAPRRASCISLPKKTALRAAPPGNRTRDRKCPRRAALTTRPRRAGRPEGSRPVSPFNTKLRSAPRPPVFPFKRKTLRAAPLVSPLKKRRSAPRTPVSPLKRSYFPLTPHAPRSRRAQPAKRTVGNFLPFHAPPKMPSNFTSILGLACCR